MTTLSSDPQFDMATASNRETVVNKGYVISEKRTVTTTAAEYIDVENCESIDIQIDNNSGGSYTFDLSLQNDGTVDSSCAYVGAAAFSQYGVTPLTLAAGAASYTADGVFRINGGGKFLKIAFGTASGTNYIFVTKRYL